MNDYGMARTSDVIAGVEWIYQNRATYNIRVANLSLHSTTPSNFTKDPLDKAVEKLWFAGVTVVVASGNYGNPDGPSGVPFAPGNDPFVITVGAVDLEDSSNARKHDIADWSAYGYTKDGFRKPEIAAAGRFIIGPVPVNATLPAERPDHVVAPGYMRLSGTSFAAPIVAGAAAQILARHPTWTPDQVKGALMQRARFIPEAPPGSAGVGELNAQRSADVRQSSEPEPRAEPVRHHRHLRQRQRDARLRRGQLVGPGEEQRLLGLGLLERRLLVGRLLERRLLVGRFLERRFLVRRFVERRARSLGCHQGGRCRGRQHHSEQRLPADARRGGRSRGRPGPGATTATPVP